MEVGDSVLVCVAKGFFVPSDAVDWAIVHLVVGVRRGETHGQGNLGEDGDHQGDRKEATRSAYHGVHDAAHPAAAAWGINGIVVATAVRFFYIRFTNQGGNGLTHASAWAVIRHPKP